MEKTSRWLLRVAEFIAATLLAIIFLTFLLQIFTRYSASIAWLMPIPAISEWMSNIEPLGWTVSLISYLWVWLIFFGCSFLLRERDHVKFDIVYLSVSPPTRRILSLIASAAVILCMLWSFLPTWDEIMANRLMLLKKVPALKIPFTGDKLPMRSLFAAYILLMIVITLRYSWRFWSAAKDELPDDEVELIVEEQLAEIAENKEVDK